ncbi:MAG: efflux RND transporter periplasmic adaptor subunit [Pseudomonadota bacterium]
MIEKIAKTILIAVIFALILSACSEAELPPSVDIIRPVKFFDLVEVSESAARTYSGSVEADTQANISFRVSGTLLNLPVEVGDRVEKGKLLAQLDSRDLTIGVREAEAQLSNARATLRNADSNYDRIRELYENDNTSKSELDSVRAAAESAKAQLRVAQQAVSNSRLQLSYSKVYAPASCEVSDKFVKVNENIAPGQSVLKLNCGTCADVRVSVPETVIGRIGRGDRVSVQVDAFPNQQFEAAVDEVAVAMDAESSAFPVVVKLKDGCDLVRAGMAAEVNFRFNAEASSKRLIVPGIALGEDRHGRYVFVLEPAEEGLWRAKRRAVEVDTEVQNGFNILSGLSAGERIVTAGVRRISDDMLVKLYENGNP